MKKGKSFTLTEETLNEISRLEKIHGLNSSSLLDRIFLEIKLTGKYTAPVANVASNEEASETKDEMQKNTDSTKEVAADNSEESSNMQEQKESEQEDSKREKYTKDDAKEKDKSNKKLSSAKKKILQNYK